MQEKQKTRIKSDSDICAQMIRGNHKSSCTFLNIFRKPLKSKSKNHLVNLSILFTLYFGKHLEKKLKIWRIIVIVGMIIFIFGIIFHLQGQSVLGPESSFMYANPDWVSYGIQIVIIGIILSGIGIGLKFKN